MKWWPDNKAVEQRRRRTYARVSDDTGLKQEIDKEEKRNSLDWTDHIAPVLSQYNTILRDSIDFLDLSVQAKERRAASSPSYDIYRTCIRGPPS